MGDGTGIEWTDATWNPVRAIAKGGDGARDRLGWHCEPHISLSPDDQAQPGPRTWAVRRVGKRAAGRVLDGVTHDGFPA